MTPRIVCLVLLAAGTAPRLARAASIPAPCLQQIDTATASFHHKQVDGALHYYKSWLPGYEAATPEVRVRASGAAGAAQTFATQVDVEAEVKVGYSRTPTPTQCQYPLPAKVHPVTGCTYHQATLHLRQTAKVTCRRASTWRCALDRKHLQSSCMQSEAPAAKGDAKAEQESLSMCPAYAPSWSWGRSADARASIHAKLAAFVAQQLEAASKDSKCPLATLQRVGGPATANDGDGD